MSSPAVWNHQADLIYFCPKQQLSYDSCDSCLIIVVTAFRDSWDSFFKTDVTADLAALATTTQNSKNTLNLNIPFLAKS